MWTFQLTSAWKRNRINSFGFEIENKKKKCHATKTNRQNVNWKRFLVLCELMTMIKLQVISIDKSNWQDWVTSEVCTFMWTKSMFFAWFFQVVYHLRQWQSEWNKVRSEAIVTKDKIRSHGLNSIDCFDLFFTRRLKRNEILTLSNCSTWRKKQWPSEMSVNEGKRKTVATEISETWTRFIWIFLGLTLDLSISIR